jgi:hypothetical protein
MIRRLITLLALCIFAALALVSPARAQNTGASHQESTQIARLGCNAPDLVPPSDEPPQWRLLVPAFCIHRTTQLVLNPQEIAAARLKGFSWCVAWSMKPTSPAGAILSWFTAWNFCSSRAWYYVNVIT